MEGNLRWITWRAKAADWPDLVSRVFQLKLKALEEDLLKDGIFGARIANLRVNEFQKREFPHAHMLIILQQRHAIVDAQQVDQIVSAEIPPHPSTIHDPDEGTQHYRIIYRIKDLCQNPLPINGIFLRVSFAGNRLQFLYNSISIT